MLPYFIPYLISAALSFSVAVYAWQHRRVIGPGAFAVSALAQASWTIFYIFELAASSMDGKLFWDNVQWITTFAIPIAMFIFALQYTDRPIFLRGNIWLWLSVAPFIFTVLAFTDNQHGWVHLNTRLLPGNPFDALTYDFTLLTWLALVYLYGLLLAGYAILVRHFYSNQGIYRQQIVTILIGFFIPVIGTMMGLAGITLSSQRDTSPLAFALGNLVIAWGLFRYHLFDIVPVARDIVIENMSDSVVVLDAENRIVDLNPAAHLQLNQPSGTQIIGQSVTQIYAQWAALIEQYQDTRQALFEIPVSISGEQRHLEVQISPIHNQQNQFIGRVVVLRNITARVRAQEELKQRMHELELANKELEIARAKAEETSEIKSQFLASMSHELRTPLNSVLNFVEFTTLGMLGEVNEKQVDALNKALESGRHLLALINDVLDITRIESGMMKLFVEENIDLREELANIMSTTESLIKDKPVQLVQEIDDNLPAITGDRRRIHQILLNLVSNAAKFTDRGQITIKARLQVEQVIITVSDTGPGIAPEDHHSIFELFEQSETGRQHGGGTGLGLPISRRLAEAHGGRLWLENEPGKGATFFVSLPIRSEELLNMIELPENT